MDLIERIDELQVILEDAKAVPLSGSAMINRDEVLELLAQLKETVPEEVRQARWLVRDRDEVLARARKEADRIITEAAEQRDRLLSRNQIVHSAQLEAERLVSEATERCTKMRLEAEDYIDQKLASFETLLTKTLKVVERGREQLRGEDAVMVGEPPAAAQSAPFDATELTGQVV
jgi:cell division septum initiation protein DivIVA